MDEQLYYQAVDGDKWDMIALRVYGDEKYTPLLIQANPDLTHKRMLSGGDLVLVPELPVDVDQDYIAPWRR